MSLKRNAPAGADDRVATREQLLDAAAGVFAEHGFHHATVREICQRARANIAAINYHFGDKERLYAGVLQHAVRAAWEKYPPTLGLGPDPTPEDRLRAFVRSFFLRIFDPCSQAAVGRLMLREMAEPTAALDAVIAAHLRPMAEYLKTIIRGILGSKASDEQVRLCGLSVVGQVLLYHQCRAGLCRLFPEVKLGMDEVECLSKHVTAFSLAALRHCADGGTPAATRARKASTRGASGSRELRHKR